MQEFYHTEQPRKLRQKLFPPARPGYKFCRDCKEEKSFDAFHKMNGSSDGYRPICKECRKERTQRPKITIQKPLFTLSKICIQCGDEKAIEDFNKMTQTKNGYHSVCRQCQSEYNHKHRLNNLEDYRTRSHVKNIKPTTKARNMERHRERSVNDPAYLELRRLRRQRYYQSHKEQAKDFYPRRKARILNATVGKVDYKRILERDDYICHICNQPIDPNAKKKSSTALAFDHVVPLHPRPNEPQGMHSEENIKPSHIACNVRKGNRPMSALTDFDRRGCV
jgi:hypothetical protein